MTTNPAADAYAGVFDSGDAAVPHQPHQTPPPPGPPPQAGPPVFGRRTLDSTSPTKRIPFTLATYDQRGTETLHPLTAVAAVDMGSVFGFGQSGNNLGKQIATIRNLLMRTLVDDDGISLREHPVQVVPRPDGDDDEWVPVDDLDDEQRRDLLGDAAWRTPDGELHDTPAEAADHTRQHGSSLRRFAAIMDDDSLIVMQEALEQIVDYIMTEAAGRPTQRSSGPSRSRRRTGR